GDASLIAIKHGEVQAVRAGQVAELDARYVAAAGWLELDDIRAQPGEELSAGRPGLNVCHVQDADALQCLAHEPLVLLNLRGLAARRARPGPGFWPSARTRSPARRADQRRRKDGPSPDPGRRPLPGPCHRAAGSTD